MTDEEVYARLAADMHERMARDKRLVILAVWHEAGREGEPDAYVPVDRILEITFSPEHDSTTAVVSYQRGAVVMTSTALIEDIDMAFRGAHVAPGDSTFKD